MWSAIFGLLALAFAGLALKSPLEGWNAFFWVLALVFLSVLAFSLSGAIGRRRSKDEPAQTTPTPQGRATPRTSD